MLPGCGSEEPKSPAAPAAKPAPPAAEAPAVTPAKAAEKKGRVVILGFDGVEPENRAGHDRAERIAESGEIVGSGRVQEARQHNPAAIACRLDILHHVQEPGRSQHL